MCKENICEMQGHKNRSPSHLAPFHVSLSALLLPSSQINVSDVLVDELGGNNCTYMASRDELDPLNPCDAPFYKSC